MEREEDAVDDDDDQDENKIQSSALLWDLAVAKTSSRPKLTEIELHIWAAALGLSAASVTELYSQTLKFLVQVIWNDLPELLGAEGKLGPWYAPFVMGTGGAVVGFLGPSLPKAYSVGDWYILLALKQRKKKCRHTKLYIFATTASN